jgi:hypothetical protein
MNAAAFRKARLYRVSGPWSHALPPCASRNWPTRPNQTTQTKKMLKIPSSGSNRCSQHESMRIATPRMAQEWTGPPACVFYAVPAWPAAMGG